jgi:hypothetical protein
VRDDRGAIALEAVGEHQSGSHRADSVETGRTDADGEQVERADGHINLRLKIDVDRGIAFAGVAAGIRGRAQRATPEKAALSEHSPIALASGHASYTVKNHKSSCEDKFACEFAQEHHEGHQ